MKLNLPTLLTGCAIGAAAMFVLDPVSGRRRRAMGRDKAVSLTHKAADIARSQGRHLRNKTRGMTAELRSKVDDLKPNPPQL